MRAVTTFVLIAAFALPGAARADWRYTRWTMNPAEVAAASKGAVSQVAAAPGERVFGIDLKATGTYATDDVQFEARFYFDATERLRLVKLTPADRDQCDGLLAQVRGMYSPPVSESDRYGMRSWKWDDPANGDRVQLVDARSEDGQIANTCWLMYRPFIASGADGP